MRAALMVVMVAGVAVASPPVDDLVQRVRAGDVRTMKSFLPLVRAGESTMIDLALAAVITDNPAVRAPLIDALIDAKAIDRPTAAMVPTARVLAKQLRVLRPNDPPNVIPAPSECRVIGGTARGATLACRADDCAEACIHVHRELTLTTGVRWRIDSDTTHRMDDGSCGDCMM